MNMHAKHEINNEPPIPDGLVIGGCYRFIVEDPDGKTYLHYFSKRETWDFIEINFLTTAGEFYRKNYERLWGREFLADYYLMTRYGIEIGEEMDDSFITRCFSAYGITGLEPVHLDYPAFPTYILGEDGMWVVTKY